MDLHLSGKRALVTGGSRGIGRAILDHLAREGVALAFCARDAKEVQATAEALKRHGVAVHGTSVDVGDEAAYRDWLMASVAALGGVDIFIPNVSAGAGDPGDDAAWHANFSVDLMHFVRGARLLLPHLSASKAGAIVVINTIAASETFLAPTSYAALKAAMLTHAKQLAKAVAAHGVRINSVSPGPVWFEGGAWDRVRHENPGFFAEIEGRCALSRMATPDDVARAALFLASPAAAAITGTNLLVDAGYSERVQF
ncbi:MAG: SDR family NAD(P)-dependent oxidoreductase [Rhodothalassiaceae bacterium]